MAINEVIQKCFGCGGTGSHTGENPGGDDPVPYDNLCLKCGGSGYLYHSTLSDDFMGFINDMNDKINDIKEKVDEIKTVVDEL
jgi:hypothetical protein